MPSGSPVAVCVFEVRAGQSQGGSEKIKRVAHDLAMDPVHYSGCLVVS